MGAIDNPGVIRVTSSNGTIGINPAIGYGVVDLTLFSANVATQSGTTYTLQSSDSGSVLRFTNGSAITLTCPNNLPVGFNVGILQIGTGQITFSPDTGATVNNRKSYTKTAGQYAAASLIVQENSGGSSASYILGGDCA